MFYTSNLLLLILYVLTFFFLIKNTILYIRLKRRLRLSLSVQTARGLSCTGQETALKPFQSDIQNCIFN